MQNLYKVTRLMNEILTQRWFPLIQVKGLNSLFTLHYLFSCSYSYRLRYLTVKNPATLSRCSRIKKESGSSNPEPRNARPPAFPHQEAGWRQRALWLKLISHPCSKLDFTGSLAPVEASRKDKTKTKRWQRQTEQNKQIKRQLFILTCKGSGEILKQMC